MPGFGPHTTKKKRNPMNEIPSIENHGTLQYIQQAETVILNVGNGVQSVTRPQAPRREWAGTALMNYVVDIAERADWAARFASAHSLSEFCRSTLYNFYSDVLCDYPCPREILVSGDFIQSLFPLLTGIEEEKEVRTVRAMIRKYTLGE